VLFRSPQNPKTPSNEMNNKMTINKEYMAILLQIQDYLKATFKNTMRVLFENIKD
jgi:hypothetical protein